MARIDRARFDAARFPAMLAVQTRFDDLDVQGHINNAAAVVILQEARAQFNIASGLPNLRGGLRTMIAGLTLEYAGEMHHPEPVEVSTGVLAIGRSSFRLGQVARQGGRGRIYSEAVMVFADADGPASIPPALRSALEGLMMVDGEATGREERA